ncbi:choice-of-anchor Q domain-containing protein [Lacipirellula parvula]|uniref:choice-of-anchor Q domain-containing protein n=1 Tax=Lacipirellula parvula TaxID=2650471 RepID=UPI0015625D27|nr:choice-of-anchor Q domain-containing protein [Lacipirellula parvula]
MTRGALAHRNLLTYEELEDRRVLATFVVSTDLDTNPDNDAVYYGSLRWAVNQANATAAADVILFSDDVFEGGTAQINLNLGQLNITQPVSILGPGAGKLTVSADADSRIFNLNIGTDQQVRNVTISGMTLQGGNITGDDAAARGGAIFSREALTLTEVIFSNNRASQGGGAVYAQFGSLTVDRSLFQNNSGGGIGGGGILNASGDDNSQPFTTISNSTFYANRAPAGGANVGFGGGVLNRNGRMEISQSTFFDNSSGSGFGEGVASWGNPLPEEEGADPPPETVKTLMTHTVVFREGSESDVAVVGESDDDPPLPLLNSFENQGYNLIGALGDQIEGGDGDLAPGTDPQLKDLDDYGGSIPVMLPNNDPEDPDFDGISPLIDAGNPERTAGQAGLYEQRGRHFTRIYSKPEIEEPIIDIGAAEVQAVVFFVDSLVDESDVQYSGTTDRLTKVIDGNLEGGNDFSLREALEFSFKNPELDTISFADSLKTEYDPTLSAAPTILLSPDFGSLVIDHEVIIQGPSTFILEVDATGTDETPSINDGFGSHVFAIDDNDVETLLNIEISYITMMGADQVGPGGGIYSNENLTLRHVTMKDNFSTLSGGAIFTQFGNLAVYDSTFNNNATSGNGGAIFVNTSGVAGVAIEALIVNSTISGNTAGGRGAGIGNDDGHVIIRNSTITLNSAASTRGSGVYSANYSNTKTEVYSSIISGNLNNDIEYATGAANTFSLGYNLIGRGNASFVFTATGDRRNILNPMLAPLANTGGFIQTHRPLAGSPIIDAGNPADVNGEGDTPETDQRGGSFVRVYDATGMGAGPGIIDIGAYELQPAVLVVDSTADVDNGDYSEGNLTLREAIKIANENPLQDFIDLTQLVGQINVTGTSLTITDSVSIEGPGWFDIRIFGTSLTTAPMFVINDGSATTTIDVSIKGVAIESARAGAINNSENLTIEQVSFQANRNTTSGGAIFQQNGSLKISNSQMNGNSTSGANADGGAIYAINSTVEILDTILVGNTAFATGADGGAIALNNAVLNATRTLISGNQAPAGTSDGGGIYATGALSAINLNDSTVSGNYTTGSNSEGGGIASYGGAVNLVDSVVSLNRTAGSQSTGGGIYLNGGTLSALRSIITQNSTTGLNAPGAGIAMIGGSGSIVESSIQGNTTSNTGGHGGGVYNVGGALIIRDSSIVENFVSHAQSKGGGVYSDTNLAGTQSTLILNTTISGNTAPLRGAGVFNADGLLEIYHSTITNNSNTATPFALMNSGNGVASQGTTATQTKIYSSIIAGNGGAATGTGTDVDFVDGNGVNSIQSLGYNVIGVGNAQAIFNKTGDQAGVTNPLLAPLQDNGGAQNNPFSVLTHALLAGSPAINAGSPTFNPSVYNPALNFDQRGEGFARVQRGRIDVGAFESDLAPALPADFTDDGKVDGSDFLTWQRNFGKTSGATKSQGDANNDGQVNSTDLTIWKTGFGSVAEPPAAMAAASTTAAAVTYTASLLAEEEPTSTFGSQGVASPVTPPAAVASSTDESHADANDYDSLASLGGPARAAAKTATADVIDDSLLWNDGAVSKVRSTSIYLNESRSEELDALFSGNEEEGAGDEVFAAWGEELL